MENIDLRKKDAWNALKRYNINILGVPDAEERKRRRKRGEGRRERRKRG